LLNLALRRTTPCGSRNPVALWSRAFPASSHFPVFDAWLNESTDLGCRCSAEALSLRLSYCDQGLGGCRGLGPGLDERNTTGGMGVFNSKTICSNLLISIQTSSFKHQTHESQHEALHSAHRCRSCLLGNRPHHLRISEWRCRWRWCPRSFIRWRTPLLQSDMLHSPRLTCS
jgi:hypothetical protein